MHYAVILWNFALLTVNINKYQQYLHLIKAFSLVIDYGEGPGADAWMA